MARHVPTSKPHSGGARKRAITRHRCGAARLDQRVRSNDLASLQTGTIELVNQAVVTARRRSKHARGKDEP